jgi:hypothetical protein
LSFVEIMHAYFRGEKLEALVFIIPAGLVLVGLGIVALKVERGGFAWGLAVPCLLFGLVAIATGATVAMRTSGQVAALERAYETAPAVMTETELPRMQRVMADFKKYFVGFGAAALLGLALLLGVRADWAAGLGRALLLVGAIGFLIDGFASRRAEPYLTALAQLSSPEGSRPASQP